MSSSNYEVIAETHVDSGREYPKGAVISLSDDVAKRHPNALAPAKTTSSAKADHTPSLPTAKK